MVFRIPDLDPVYAHGYWGATVSAHSTHKDIRVSVDARTQTDTRGSLRWVLFLSSSTVFILASPFPHALLLQEKPSSCYL